MMAQILPFQVSPDQRLRAALIDLESALAEQGLAVAAFRAGLQQLSGAVQGLGGAVGGYRQTLHAIHAELGAARSAHEELARFAGTRHLP